MNKSTNPDFSRCQWSRLSPCDLTTTLAFENAKKLFPSKSEDLWKDVAALATIEATFTEGYECNIIDLVDAIRTVYKIDRPLFSSKSLRYHPFLSVNRDTVEFTTQKWLLEVAEKPIENHIFEDQNNVEQRFRDVFKSSYGKDIIFWTEMNSDIFKNACISNSQNKTFVVDWRSPKSNHDFERFDHLQFFAKELGLDVGFICSSKPSGLESTCYCKFYIDEGK